jgi:uridine phosphorylase
VWTTDAPYRETAEQLRFWAERDVLAVEMQAASLFAFGRARGAAVAAVALVSNSVDQVVTGFDTGGDTFRMKVLAAIARAAQTCTFRSEERAARGMREAGSLATVSPRRRSDSQRS